MSLSLPLSLSLSISLSAVARHTLYTHTHSLYTHTHTLYTHTHTHTHTLTHTLYTRTHTCVISLRSRTLRSRSSRLSLFPRDATRGDSPGGVLDAYAEHDETKEKKCTACVVVASYWRENFLCSMSLDHAIDWTLDSVIESTACPTVMDCRFYGDIKKRDTCIEIRDKLKKWIPQFGTLSQLTAKAALTSEEMNTSAQEDPYSSREQRSPMDLHGSLLGEDPYLESVHFRNCETLWMRHASPQSCRESVETTRVAR